MAKIAENKMLTAAQLMELDWLSRLKSNAFVSVESDNSLKATYGSLRKRGLVEKMRMGFRITPAGREALAETRTPAQLKEEHR